MVVGDDGQTRGWYLSEQIIPVIDTNLWGTRSSGTALPVAFGSAHEGAAVAFVGADGNVFRKTIGFGEQPQGFGTLAARPAALTYDATDDRWLALGTDGSLHVRERDGPTEWRGIASPGLRRLLQNGADAEAVALKVDRAGFLWAVVQITGFGKAADQTQLWWAPAADAALVVDNCRPLVMDEAAQRLALASKAGDGLTEAIIVFQRTADHQWLESSQYQHPSPERAGAFATETGELYLLARSGEVVRISGSDASTIMQTDQGEGPKGDYFAGYERPLMEVSADGKCVCVIPKWGKQLWVYRQ